MAYRVSRLNKKHAFEPDHGQRLQTLLIGNDLAVFCTWVEPGNDAIVYPGHPTEEALIVIQGKVRVTIGTSSFELDGGTATLIPRDADHCVVNVGKEESMVLSVMTPKSISHWSQWLQELVKGSLDSSLGHEEEVV